MLAVIIVGYLGVSTLTNNGRTSYSLDRTPRTRSSYVGRAIKQFSDGNAAKITRNTMQSLDDILNHYRSDKAMPGKGKAGHHGKWIIL